MSQKSKSICILDSNNYFVKVSTIFIDKKRQDFPSVENGYDIQKPDLQKIRSDINLKALWNFEEETWSYETKEKIISEDLNSVKLEKKVIEEVAVAEQYDPMYYLRISRNMRLDESDEWLIILHDKKKEIPKSLSEYRDKLRELPNKIEDKKIDPPKLIEKDKIENLAHPDNFIEFNWPEPPKLEL